MAPVALGDGQIPDMAQPYLRRHRGGPIVQAFAETLPDDYLGDRVQADGGPLGAVMGGIGGLLG